jgi:hypothetical protein
MWSTRLRLANATRPNHAARSGQGLATSAWRGPGHLRFHFEAEFWGIRGPDFRASWPVSKPTLSEIKQTNAGPSL